MEKRNDYFLNLLTNPTFNAFDFNLVGLSVDNTSIQDKNTYLNSEYIRNLDMFQTNGNFDLSKFDNFYDYAKNSYVDLTRIKEVEDLGTTWRAFRDDITMPEYLRDNSPQFKIQKVANPLRQLSSFASIGLKEDPTLSIREIALTQKVFDPETGTWKDSPNDTWFDNFINPKILATWDFDADANGNPTNDKNKIVYHKGDRKLNANGTYYYENLGNRSIYGKEVLSAFDTLTTDGSKWNKFDFLDSDDIDKTAGGAMMKAIAQIAPAFIPGIGEWYIGARVALGMSLILPAVGKTLESLTETSLGTSLFNKMEAWDKALTFSQSDWTQGSQTDDGKILQDTHLWSMETAFKLIADVFTQLAELRWMFEKSTSLFSGLNKNIITSKEAQNKWIEDFIAKNANKRLDLEQILQGVNKGVDPIVIANTQKAINWSNALKALSDKLKGAQELGSKVSMAYMTGITTASAYGEAKELGASDLEAALFTLGYTFGEWKLLNTELGKWILPELKQEKTHMKNVIAKSMEKIKDVGKDLEQSSEIKKANIFSKIFNIGKLAYENNLGLGIGSEIVGSTISNSASEALEEVSEELLLDLSKTLFNAGASLVGSTTQFLDAFKNVFDRYALSFIGGAVGGGLAGILSGHYKQARYDRNMSHELAVREIVDYVLQGKALELVNTANKMTLSNKYINDEGNPVDEYTQSVDYLAKQNFARLVQDVSDILNSNGANLSNEALTKELTKDIKYGLLASVAAEESNSIGWYLNHYNELSSDLVLLSLELKLLLDKPDRYEFSEEEKAKEKELKEKIKLKKEALDKYKDGTMSDEFILDVLFEMIPKISSEYITTPERWIEEKAKKPISELSDDELRAFTREWNDTKPLRRDMVRLGRQVHIKNMEVLTNMLNLYHDTYFLNKDEMIANLNEILFGNRNQIVRNPNEAVPLAQDFIALYKNDINEFLRQFQAAILANLDNSKETIDRLKIIEDMPTSLTLLLGPLDSIENLRNLSEENKLKLLNYLDPTGNAFMGNFDALLDDYIESYTENEENKERLIDNFFKDIKDINVLLQIERAEAFNKLLIDFLSDSEVKNLIINKLSSAKYILPSVKVALENFFRNGLSYQETYEDDMEESGEVIITKKLSDKDIADYIAAFLNVPSSPVDLYLGNVVTTLRSLGINFHPLVSDMDELIFKLARAKNLESFSYDDQTEKLIELALKIIRFAKSGLDSAATTIDGDLSDMFGYNVTVNEIREKRGNKTKLATIPSDIAEGIKLDIDKYEQTLQYYLALFNYNNNAILNEHDKTYYKQSLNLHNRLKAFVAHIEVPDWNDLDKLKSGLLDFSIQEVMTEIEEDRAPITQEFKEKLTKARLLIDKLLFNFFLANEDKVKDKEKLHELIKGFKIEHKFGSDSYTELNAQEASLPDKDFLWYLASMAAVNPEVIMSQYKTVISANFAPVIGQEEVVRLAMSFIINPEAFKNFAEAWNIEAKNSPTDAPYTIITAYRSIFIEGMPGSGKSSAVLNTIRNILHEYYPSVEKNIVIVSNSKENAKTLTTNLGFNAEEAQYFGIEDFRNKLLNNYSPISVDSSGSINAKKEDVEFDVSRNMFKYKEATLNPNALNASFIIVDEATSLSLMDVVMLEEFMSTKGIYGIYAGDFDQIGASGKIGTVLLTQDATNYITTHKLGLIIRGNNKLKSDNTIGLKLNKIKFIHSLVSKNPRIDPVTLLYYLDDTGIYGDIVAKADVETTSEGIKKHLSAGTKSIIETMINSLQEGEKINFINDDPSSEMYIYLHENYEDKINDVSTKAAQSLEGLYYIVDVELRDSLPETNAESLLIAANQFKMLYTAMSRAKLATLIYDRGDNDEKISKRLNSTRMNKLITTVIGQLARETYAINRKKAIEAAIPENVESVALLWKKETPPPVEPPEDDTEEDLREENVTVLNTPKEVNIKNDSEDSLNMMIHSFNCNELGGTIDDNGQLTFDDFDGERIDNARGIVKALGISVTDGKLSVEDTSKVISILDRVRTAGLYEHSKEDLEAAIKDVLFGKSSTHDIAVNFIYKNSSELDSLTSKGGLKKWFKTQAEKLRYLFSEETDPSKKKQQEKARTRTIGLEIFVDGKQIDIPLGTLTNPATLIRTAGFELLADIYDLVHGELSLVNFELELIKRKNEDIPHIKEMLKLLELYLWNINHPSHKNFVVRLDRNFVLNAGGNKITGVQLPPSNKVNGTPGSRGDHYIEEALKYPGRRISLEEYRREMPNRKISAIYEAIDGDLTNPSGEIILKRGNPFILVSDYYHNMDDVSLYREYIKQELEGKEPKITRVYLYAPKAGLDYFLWNQQEAFRKDDEAKATDLDSLIGNKMTSYRLLSFMLKNNSNFLRAYEEFLNSDRVSGKVVSESGESLKDSIITYSKRRVERLQAIMEYLSDYENKLTPQVQQRIAEDGGTITVSKSVAKQMLEFLDQNLEEVKDSSLKSLFFGKDQEALIGHSKKSLRTILLYEFRRLLLGSGFSENGTKITLGINTLGDIQITRNGDTFEYQDFLKDRVEALKLDAQENNWDEIMFRSRLEKLSEISASVGNKNFKIAKVQAKDNTYLSENSFEINGKLDTTAVIMDVVPMLNDILSKLVASKDGSVTSSVIREANYSDGLKTTLYRENTGGYLEGRNRIKKDLIQTKISEFLSKIIDKETINQDLLIESLKEYLTKNGTSQTIEKLLFDPTNGLFTLGTIKAIAVGNKYKLVTIKGQFLLYTNNRQGFYYLDRGNVYKNSGEIVEDVNTLNYIYLQTKNSEILDIINRLTTPLEQLSEDAIAILNLILSSTHVYNNVTLDLEILIEDGVIKIDENGKMNIDPIVASVYGLIALYKNDLLLDLNNRWEAFVKNPNSDNLKIILEWAGLDLLKVSDVSKEIANLTVDGVEIINNSCINI